MSQKKMSKTSSRLTLLVTLWSTLVPKKSTLPRLPSYPPRSRNPSTYRINISKLAAQESRRRHCGQVCLHHMVGALAAKGRRAWNAGKSPPERQARARSKVVTACSDRRACDPRQSPPLPTRERAAQSSLHYRRQAAAQHDAVTAVTDRRAGNKRKPPPPPANLCLAQGSATTAGGGA